MTTESECEESGQTRTVSRVPDAPARGCRVAQSDGLVRLTIFGTQNSTWSRATRSQQLTRLYLYSKQRPYCS